MTGAASPDPWRASLEQQRDQALRDLLELDQQVAAGEVPSAAAEGLRRRYERSAAEALALLAGEGQSARPGGRRRPSWRAGVYAAAALAAVVALAVVLPPALQARPAGGFVTGNEALAPVASPSAPPSSAPSAPPAGRDLSKVSDAEMEAVVAANPEVIGMRLALAQRYLEQGDFDKALPHYRQVLERQPRNAPALASLGWLLLQSGDGEAAASYAERAVESDPASPEVWWVQANIRLYGQDDPAGAVEALQRMQRLPLDPTVAQQVSALLAQAQSRAGADPGQGTP